MGAGFFEMAHGSHYTIQLTNHRGIRCDARISIDGQPIGTWRINSRSSIRLERPVDFPGRFTFYELGTPEANASGLREHEDLGLISVEFRPEADTGILYAPAIGGTGYSGFSDQASSETRALSFDPKDVVSVDCWLLPIVKVKSAYQGPPLSTVEFSSPVPVAPPRGCPKCGGLAGLHEKGCWTAFDECKHQLAQARMQPGGIPGVLAEATRAAAKQTVREAPGALFCVAIMFAVAFVIFVFMLGLLAL